MARPHTTANYYRKKVDVLSRQLTHTRYLQRWALKLLEELETNGLTEETYLKFRDALKATGSEIQGPGHPHVVHGVRASKPKQEPKETGKRHRWPTREQIDGEVKRLSRCIEPFSDCNQWEIL